MGNESAKESTRYRTRTLDPRKNFSIDPTLKYDRQLFEKSSILEANKPPSTQRNRKRSLNTINYDDSVMNMLNEPSRQIKSKNSKAFSNNQYLTLESNPVKSISNSSPLGKKSAQQKDRVLTNLSRKNQQLRKELKQINEQLTEKLKRKKLVPKKKKDIEEDQENIQNKKQLEAKTAGLRRQLQNGYKQIDMYKRTLQQLNAKQETKITHTKVKQMQNQVAQLDRIINQTMKKIDGMKNIKKNQQKILQHDINQELIDNLQVLKREEEEIKIKMKEVKKRQQQRENNYKRQQAYLFQVEKKYREMAGQYFPELKKKAVSQSGNKESAKKPSTFDKYSTNKKSSNQQQSYPSSYEVTTTTRELQQLRNKHQEYHRKIDTQLQVKNKTTDEVEKLDQQIIEKDKTIESLKQKLIGMKKIIRPNKKSLFGYDSYGGTDLQSQYGGVSQAEKEIEEQKQQDQFDIKHLIANIPKPIRLKPVEMQVNNSIRSGQSGNRGNQIDGKGMVITGEKSQPKVWGNTLTRKQEKGKFYKNQLSFDDTVQFENAQIQPLIIGVNGWVNKNGDILALQAIYLNGDEIRYGVKSSANADGFMIRYDLQAPDYLKNVIGGFGENGVLEYIAFYSKKGKSGTFGNKRDYQQSFTFGLANSQRPFRFNGASIMLDSQPRICRLGIQICAQ